MTSDWADREKGAAPAAMQGGGFYNRNSTLQAANIVSALPLLEDAAANAPLVEGVPLVLVDYGASQGRNSMAPVSAVVDRWRARVGSSRAVEIVHADMASNDFATLFTLIESSPESYRRGDAMLFPSGVGRSHFEPIRPPNSVDLGWSANALHWMSRNPIDIPDHGWAILGRSAEARAAVVRQLDEDWRRFLMARGSELRLGGRLVCQFMGHGDDHHGFEWMASAFWASWASMARDGLLTDEELLRMTVASAGRTIDQIRRPFDNGAFAGLTLSHLSLVRAPDPFWQAYADDGNARQFGERWANLMRAANGSSFAAGLDPGRDREWMLDEMTARLADRVAADPQQSVSYNILLTIQKIG